MIKPRVGGQEKAGCGLVMEQGLSITSITSGHPQENIRAVFTLANDLFPPSRPARDPPSCFGGGAEAIAATPITAAVFVPESVPTVGCCNASRPWPYPQCFTQPLVSHQPR